MKIRCLTIDDEPLALNLVSSYVERTPFLELAGKCNSAQQALERMNEEVIDLLFMDIQMPDLTGIEFARAMDKGPKIIFTTAFEQYALEGFKLDAMDYLLKPFNYQDFLRSANKAKEHFELVHKAAQSEQVHTEHDFLFVKSEYKLIKIKFESILYIEGLKDYVKILLVGANKPILSLLSLKNLEGKIPTDRFMRVHRSYIVALDKISAISNNVIIINNTNIPVGEMYKDDFYKFLERRTL
ncbi:response regulator transcription factor [Rhodocytophaga rosea]|uniref:Response regulator transcription factor n=1 Tax=Rhodocytophaga rosea TaxID=2704465 RepID=A0A6C0GIS5_9BACT|nr:LytTR family DNA-binding domain-containing protein [Rhodocytophaga rosea]QHT67835.1 response regulator transcription factor [Rhodocytophaga rosea]